jgi:hypothetical protein
VQAINVDPCAYPRFETEEEAVTVLNVLGYNGYTVVGMARNIANRYYSKFSHIPPPPPSPTSVSSSTAFVNFLQIATRYIFLPS